MIGKIYSSLTPYYYIKTGQNKFKKRPVLIISGPRNNDYTVLPISRISKKENIDDYYDVEVSPEEYPKLNLNSTSYVRTHKQTVIHRGSLSGEIGDLRGEYEDLYHLILKRLEEFNTYIMESALERT